jgi:hypothetical protein
MIELQDIRRFMKLVPSVMLLAAGCALVAYPFTTAAQAATDSETPTLTVTVQAAITLTLPVTTIAFPALTPGTPVATSSTSTIATNNSTGFNFALSRSDDNATMDLTTNAAVDIPDMTEWVPAAATTSAGRSEAYAATTSLAFRVPITGTTTCLQAATWWGVDGSPLYAGIPTSSAASKKIADCSVYQGSNSSLPIWYKLDVPTTQQTGNYDGTVTYTVTTNP